MRKITYNISLLFIFIIPWENFIVLENFGTISRIIGFLLIGLWFLTVVSTNRVKKLHPFHVIVIFFLFWQFFTVLWSADPSSTMVRVTTQLQLVIFLILIWDLYDNDIQLLQGLQAYVFGSYITIASIYQNYLLGFFESHYRTSALGFNLNDASLILAIGIPIAWYLTIYSNPKAYILRWINYLYIPVSVVAILLTGSRTSLFALIPALLFIFGSFKKISFQTKLFIFVLLFSLFFVTQDLIPASTLERLFAGTVTEISTLNFNGRRNIWLNSIEIIQVSPIVGIGAGVGQSEVGASIHNTFISVLLELGVVGLLLLSWILTKIVEVARNQTQHKIRSLWIVILWILLIANLLHVWQYRKQTWLIFAFILVSSKLLTTNNAKVIRTYQ